MPCSEHIFFSFGNAYCDNTLAPRQNIKLNSLVSHNIQAEHSYVYILHSPRGDNTFTRASRSACMSRNVEEMNTRTTRGLASSSVSVSAVMRGLRSGITGRTNGRLRTV